MDPSKLEDTFDFSALDALSSSSTPRLLRRDNGDKDVLRGRIDDASATAARNDSNYSLHLSGLLSPTSGLNLDREVLKIDSEDIGGPSDFTLNLAEYINGSQAAKPNAGPVEAEQHQSLVGETSTSHVGQSGKQHKQPSVEESQTPLPMKTTSAINDSVRKISVAESQTPLPTKTTSAINDTTRKTSEESQTPLPMDAVRRISSAARQSQDLLASSQCLATPPPLPQTDLPAQLEALQRRCEDLQRNNEKLNRLLKHNREDELQRLLKDERRQHHTEKLAAQTAALTSATKLAEAEQRTKRAQADLVRVEGQLAQTRHAAKDATREFLATEQMLTDKIISWQQQVNQGAKNLALIRSQQDEADKTHSHMLQQIEKQLAAQQQQNAAIRQTLQAEYDGVTKDVDSWLLSKLEEKERWYAAINARRKLDIEELKTDNARLTDLLEVSGKEIMRLWGERQFGAAATGEKQKYQYQHA